MSEDVHPEGAGNLPHRPADPAMPDDPERQPGKLDEVAVPIAEIGAGGPAPLMDRCVVMAGAVGELQQQREDGLGDVGRAVFGDITNRNAASLRGGNIDDVEPGGEHAHHLQGREGSKSLGREHRLVREHDIRTGSPGNDIARLRPIVDGQFPEPSERLPGEVTGVGGVAVEDNDLRHGGTGGRVDWKAPTIAAFPPAVTRPAVRPSARPDTPA